GPVPPSGTWRPFRVSVSTRCGSSAPPWAGQCFKTPSSRSFVPRAAGQGEVGGSRSQRKSLQRDTSHGFGPPTPGSASLRRRYLPPLPSVVGDLSGFELFEDFFEPLPHRGETLPAEREQVRGPLHVVDQPIDVNILSHQPGMDRPQLVERLLVAPLFFAHSDSTVIDTDPSVKRTVTFSPDSN